MASLALAGSLVAAFRPSCPTSGATQSTKRSSSRDSQRPQPQPSQAAVARLGRSSSSSSKLSRKTTPFTGATSFNIVSRNGSSRPATSPPPRALLEHGLVPVADLLAPVALSDPFAPATLADLFGSFALSGLFAPVAVADVFAPLALGDLFGPVSLADLFAPLALADLSGPIELAPDAVFLDPWAVPEASPLQTAASVLLTGAITILLVRSLRRRAQKAKDLKLRSDYVEKITSGTDATKEKPATPQATEEAPPPPPTVLGTLSGALVAGSIALICYKFTTSVEENFATQVISSNYTVRNITLTVRTIILGSSWLATFVFAANALGLTLYAFQLALGLGDRPSEVKSKSSEGESVATNEVQEKTD